MRVVIVIPCLNEELHIGRLVKKARLYAEVVVTDDNSTDNSVLVAIEAGADVVQNPYRRGFGNNVIAGISYALENYRPDVVVTLDGDEQHNPDEIPKLLKPILRGEADLVIGSRFLSRNDIPLYRQFGIKVITLLYNIGATIKITDSQCCFRAYTSRLLKEVYCSERNFGFSTEILIKARALGFRITEVPAGCIYHQDFRQNSTMNPVIQGIGVSISTIKNRLKVGCGRWS